MVLNIIDYGISFISRSYGVFAFAEFLFCFVYAVLDRFDHYQVLKSFAGALKCYKQDLELLAHGAYPLQMSSAVVPKHTCQYLITPR